MRFAIPLALLYLLPLVLSPAAGEAGRTWHGPSNCLGTFSPGGTVCRTNFDVDVKDAMFIRNVDQLGAYSSALLPAATGANDSWNELDAPHEFANEANINDTFNFLNAATSQEMANRFAGEFSSAITVACNEFNSCTHRLDVTPGNIEYSEVWINIDANDLERCVSCLPMIYRKWVLTHEFGHVLGLGHLGTCASDLDPSLMCAGSIPPGVLPGPGATEMGSATDCRVQMGSPSDDGIRCIYNWYNCTGGSDCDGVSGSADNCPTMPNQTQRNYDGEILDLGSEAT